MSPPREPPGERSTATTRSEQRAATRARIVRAAADAFAEKGFQATSTREIAKRAGTNQGLITYHFRSKEDLWRSSVGGIFDLLRARLRERLAAARDVDPHRRARTAVAEYVRFAADHPELLRIMVEEGKSGDRRMRWLVDTHLKPIYDDFVRPGLGLVEGLDESLVPHFYYAMAGAASLIFAVAPECRRLTGLDPTTERAIDAHAELVARLLIPDTRSPTG